MAQISQERFKLESAFMQAFWKLRKEIGTPEETDKYWDDLIDKVDKIYNQFGRDEYVKNILLVMVDDLERRERGVTGDNSVSLLNRLRKEVGLPPVEVKK